MGRIMTMLCGIMNGYTRNKKNLFYIMDLCVVLCRFQSVLPSILLGKQ